MKDRHEQGQNEQPETVTELVKLYGQYSKRFGTSAQKRIFRLVQLLIIVTFYLIIFFILNTWCVSDV